MSTHFIRKLGSLKSAKSTVYALISFREHICAKRTFSVQAIVASCGKISRNSVKCRQKICYREKAENRSIERSSDFSTVGGHATHRYTSLYGGDDGTADRRRISRKNTAQFSNESILAVIKQRTRHGEEAAV